ncbi:hypothetical protein [Saccharopolyspora taberi]|uniref:Uncharacterized protein n=1 Tax=Saccharopolyspora taberi TaxID=60895 RepID=A0ABN3V789_9PSEU
MSAVMRKLCAGAGAVAVAAGMMLTFSGPAQARVIDCLDYLATEGYDANKWEIKQACESGERGYWEDCKTTLVDHYVRPYHATEACDWAQQGKDVRFVFPR